MHQSTGILTFHQTTAIKISMEIGMRKIWNANLSLQFYNRGLTKNAAPLLFQGWVIVEQSLEAYTLYVPPALLIYCEAWCFWSFAKKMYFVSKVVLFSDHEKLLKIWGWRQRITKIFEITRTIYSNSERSVQFLKQNVF